MKTQLSVWDNPTSFKICLQGLDKRTAPTHGKISNSIPNAHAVLKFLKVNRLLLEKEFLGKHGITKIYFTNLDRLLLRSVFLNHSKILNPLNERVNFLDTISPELVKEIELLAKRDGLNAEDAVELGTILPALNGMDQALLKNIKKNISLPGNWEAYAKSQPGIKELMRHAKGKQRVIAPTIDGFLLTCRQ